MSTKHTPGPWTLSRSASGNLFVYSAARKSSIAGVAMVARDIDRAEGEENAHLIAAAPDLLAALRLYIQAGHGNSTDHYQQGRAYAAAVAAIAKARGES